MVKSFKKIKIGLAYYHWKTIKYLARNENFPTYQLDLKQMKLKFAALCLLPFFGLAHAKPNFSGPDVSGIYACQGDDAIEGKYTG